jgi:putative FmdB family regulatory protein
VPTYQYACTACGEQLEVVQSFSDEPLTTCPTCEGRLRKVFSPVGIVFKGSGFYRNDSREKVASGAKSSGADGAGDGEKSAKSSSSAKGSSGDSGSSGSSSASNGKSGKSTESGTSARTKSGKAASAGTAA